jgi:predicted component of type VI protein secretion system
MIPLTEAATYIVPVVRSSGERIRALREGASGRYVSASKPGVYQSTGQDAGQKQIRKFEYEEPAKPKNAVGSTASSRVGAR